MKPATDNGLLVSRGSRVLVVGGLTRLQPHYRKCLPGVEIEVANANNSRLSHEIVAADAVLILVPHISHAAVARVRDEALRHGLPVARAFSSGVTEVRRSIVALIDSGVSPREPRRVHGLAG